MKTELFKNLEDAVRKNNPLLAGKLRPGLPQSKIRAALGQAKVPGDLLEELVLLYSWKNGTILDNAVATSKRGICPGKPYYFLSLEMAIGHWGHIRAATKKREEITKAINYYFPLLWDGSNSWIAIGLAPPVLNRVAVIDLRSQTPLRQIYDSLDAFIADMVRVQEGSEILACFKQTD